MSAIPGRRQASHREQPTDTELAWTARAACRGADPDLFHPRDPSSNHEAAFAYCYRCPVPRECLSYALRSPDGKHGIWGATTEAEREVLRAPRRKGSAA
ncbi:WhiB family transcriptional regulator [Mycobacterium avium]|uniref:WhiB family transcriptional regulator n=1 Tax=Mycobacterium avium TaxID=1764 RepID=UPI001CC9AAF2|nr:WhiB family transcriptional regulator [Mycobacterium avium]